MVKRVSQQTMDARKVPVHLLRLMTQPEEFACETTREVEPLREGIIGQDRAVKAMDFGLKVRQSGYNLFLVGPSGTGKTTYARTKIREIANSKPVPLDWCYVYNFDRPDCPNVLSFPAGTVRIFEGQIDELLRDVEREVRKVFAGDDYEKHRRFVIQNYENKAKDIWKQVEDHARELNFSLERMPQGEIVTVPLQFGKPLSKEEYNQLSESLKKEIAEKGKQIENEVSEISRQIQLIEKEMEQEIAQLNKDSARYAVHHLFLPLLENYTDEKIQRYLYAYETDLIENYHFFKEAEDNEKSQMAQLLQGTPNNLTRYKVNVFVDNKELRGAPAIIENNPTYYNMFGKIEYKGSFGTMMTDFTMIKPGALHLANGGYLILQAGELLSNPLSWNVLKRTLKTGRIRIENIPEERGLVASAGLKPEPIPLNIKVVLIGTPDLYELLSELDEDFHKLFKVKVEFDTEMNKNSAHYQKFAAFVRNYCDEQGLLPFSRSALAALIDYSSRLVGDQRKLSTRFHEMTRLLVEASYWAEEAGVAIVDAGHVRQALDEQEYRSNRVDEKLRSLIEEGTIMVDVTGEKVGQINGLAVLQIGNYAFGQPHRITAQTFTGRQGIINIERETALSGQIHHKGLLILSGYLAGLFAQDKPLPLSASLTFEQTYSMIDGDSASSTELYALLSSLSDIPIKQAIAVTGSVNQWGEIQPIGGVNEKIEGFFAVCEAVGLTGEQGVIIPRQNVKNLMLRQEVVDAVKQGFFHIWQVSTIEEGIEILTGVVAGDRDEFGGFPDDTLFGRVNARLERMSDGANKIEEVIDAKR
ncbi:ATP-binding protein [Aneurinibacillus terranovensis]|uniref:ATP-binding protein n=1 Tax=Aneurinibacillus terranovensis TaxID=278991 RepID=UPI0003F5EC07|nr:ATP-binding protein [Aneurinibacillus terranovensis]